MELFNKVTAKKEKRILGLMSGTSLDGLDLALCRIKGHGSGITVDVDYFESVAYRDEIREKLASLRSADSVDLMELCLMNSWFGELMGDIVNETLKKWKVRTGEVDLIASHGQTVYHAPRSRHQIADMPNSTLQMGDGDHLAVKTGIPVMSDFRQKHTAFGGEGAPLAAPVDYLMFTHPDEARILLNIGGIANFTWLPATGEFKDVVTMDTGPGNTLIDLTVREKFDRPFDRDGRIAALGRINRKLLHSFLHHPFFKSGSYKTTGQELFNSSFIEEAMVTAGYQQIDGKNLVATLTRLTADTIANSIRNIVPSPVNTVMYVSGGGAHNVTLLKWLSESLPGITIKPFGKLGFDPDAKEAMLFAVLAYESLFGDGVPYPGKDKTCKIRLGKLSFPD